VPFLLAIDAGVPVFVEKGFRLAFTLVWVVVDRTAGGELENAVVQHIAVC
jgi:hypothetical protein